jgi:hypothetical protein
MKRPWCRRTAQADETVIFDVAVFFFSTEYFTWRCIFTQTRNLELAVHSEIPGGLCQEGAQRRDGKHGPELGAGAGGL